jgi:outer membrane protein assembly factor BamE
MFRSFLAVPLASLALAPLAACTMPRIPGITPYKIDIQQGNFISQDMVAQLKAGMSKDQVRIALGTPLLTDVFHADRWDYVYWREAPDGKRESRRLAIFFADGKLATIGGDVVSARPEDGPTRAREVPGARTLPQSSPPSAVPPAAQGAAAPATSPTLSTAQPAAAGPATEGVPQPAAQTPQPAPAQTQPPAQTPPPAQTTEPAQTPPPAQGTQ